MKFVTFVGEDQPRVGGLKQNRVVDITRDFGSLESILRNNQLADAILAIEKAAPGTPQDQIEFLPPITHADKYFCIGVNYANRNAEYKDGSDQPKNPSVFMRSKESFVGHQQFIERPPESQQLDYEGEIAVIIGKAGRRIPKHKAREHIAGLTLMNEGTLRDWVRHAKFNVTQGKNFERSGALGPWMITMDEVGDLTNLDLQTHVNGELRQNDNTSSMMFSY